MVYVAERVQEQLKALQPYIRDPAKFSAGLLGHRTWWRQRHLQRSVARYPRVAVKACHKSSKTFTAAELVLWWLLRWDDGKVITTSPTFDQIKRQLWPEIRTMARESMVAFPEPQETSLVLDDNRFAMGRSARDELAFAGWSGRLLVIIDEAPGVRGHIFEALKGVQAGGQVTILMLGNPTVLGGPYQDAFTKNRARWHVITMSAWDTPKVRPILHPVGRPDPGLDPYGPADRDEALVAWLKRTAESKWPAVDPAFHNLASPSWILERWEEDGPGSIDWEARVMGRFPSHGQADLIASAWLEAHEHEKKDPGGPVDIGIDVAGAGESETVVTVRCIGTVLEQHFRKQADPEGWVLRIVRRWHRTGRLRFINVDSVGIGDGLWKILRKHFGDVQSHGGARGVWGVNVGLNPQSPTVSGEAQAKEDYRNLKAQLYWGLRLRAKSKEGICGVDDPETVSQLSTIRWNENPRGQIEIEGKDQRRARGLSSPDRAESTMLAFAEPAVRAVPRREPLHY